MGSLLEEMAKAEATKVGISSESTSVLGTFVVGYMLILFVRR